MYIYPELCGQPADKGILSDDLLKSLPSPSKTQRTKKSDNKKPRKTTKKKTPDKPKPKPCEWYYILCQFNQKFTSGGGAEIIPGLEGAPKIPLLA